MTARLFRDRERALVQRLGVGIAALVRIEAGEIIDRDAYIVMIGAERFLRDPDRAREKRRGVGVTALLAIKLAEVVECGGDAPVIGAERLFQNLQTAFVEGFCCLVAPQVSFY